MFASLEGKVALVTGASRGIGRGIAKRFGAAGLSVAAVSRSSAEAEAAAAEIGGDAMGIATDVSDAQACEVMVSRVLDRFGRLDILCVNAGIYPLIPLEETTVTDFDRVVATNLRSTFLTIRAGLPPMLKTGWGRIVIVSSITGPITGTPGYASYGATKAGQLGFMRSAALELATRGITVNAVMPGNIVTERKRQVMSPEHLAKLAGMIPMKHLGDPEDIANAVLFFASREAGYITGQTLVVDGGQVLPEWPV